MDLITLIITIMTFLFFGKFVFQDGVVYPFGQKKIVLFRSLDTCLCFNQYSWAVKLGMGELDLLNVVTFDSAQKTAESPLIYTQNHNFRG